MFKKAFTLAEVLITLGIIGIVAQMTIPMLMASTQKQQYLTGFKNAYSEWNQALALMANDAGCPGDLGCFFDNDANDLNTMGDKISKYFKTTKICKADQGKMGCFPDKISAYMDNRGAWDGMEYDYSYRFMTASGMSIEMFNANQDCTGEFGDNNMSKGCMEYFYVDTNGLKKPNTYGRDIFFFAITNGKGPALYPWSGIDCPWGYWKDNGCFVKDGSGRDGQDQAQDGSLCAGRIIDDGMQMKY